MDLEDSLGKIQQIGLEHHERLNPEEEEAEGNIIHQVG